MNEINSLRVIRVKSGYCWINRLGRPSRLCPLLGIANSKILVDLVADCLQLTLLELADLDPAPALGGTDKCGIHQLQNGALAKAMRDDLGASPLLAEQPLEQIGGADRPAVAERKLQMRDARREVVIEAGYRRVKIPTVGRRNVVAQQARQRRRGRLVARRSAGLELRPDVLGHFALQVAHLVRQAALAQTSAAGIPRWHG